MAKLITQKVGQQTELIFVEKSAKKAWPKLLKYGLPLLLCTVVVTVVIYSWSACFFSWTRQKIVPKEIRPTSNIDLKDSSLQRNRRELRQQNNAISRTTRHVPEKILRYYFMLLDRIKEGNSLSMKNNTAAEDSTAAMFISSVDDYLKHSDVNHEQTHHTNLITPKTRFTRDVKYHTSTRHHTRHRGNAHRNHHSPHDVKHSTPRKHKKTRHKKHSMHHAKPHHSKAHHTEPHHSKTHHTQPHHSKPHLVHPWEEVIINASPSSNPRNDVSTRNNRFTLAESSSDVYPLVREIIRKKGEREVNKTADIFSDAYPTKPVLSTTTTTTTTTTTMSTNSGKINPQISEEIPSTSAYLLTTVSSDITQESGSGSGGIDAFEDGLINTTDDDLINTTEDGKLVIQKSSLRIENATKRSESNAEKTRNPHSNLKMVNTSRMDGAHNKLPFNATIIDNKISSNVSFLTNHSKYAVHTEKPLDENNITNTNMTHSRNNSIPQDFIKNNNNQSYTGNQTANHNKTIKAETKISTNHTFPQNSINIINNQPYTGNQTSNQNKTINTGYKISTNHSNLRLASVHNVTNESFPYHSTNTSKQYNVTFNGDVLKSNLTSPSRSGNLSNSSSSNHGDSKTGKYPIDERVSFNQSKSHSFKNNTLKLDRQNSLNSTHTNSERLATHNATVTKIGNATVPISRNYTGIDVLNLRNSTAFNDTLRKEDKLHSRNIYDVRNTSANQNITKLNKTVDHGKDFINKSITKMSNTTQRMILFTNLNQTNHTQSFKRLTNHTLSHEILTNYNQSFKKLSNHTSFYKILANHSLTKLMNTSTVYISNITDNVKNNRTKNNATSHSPKSDNTTLLIKENIDNKIANKTYFTDTIKKESTHKGNTTHLNNAMKHFQYVSSLYENKTMTVRPVNTTSSPLFSFTQTQSSNKTKPEIDKQNLTIPWRFNETRFTLDLGTDITELSVSQSNSTSPSPTHTANTTMSTTSRSSKVMKRKINSLTTSHNESTDLQMKSSNVLEILKTSVKPGNDSLPFSNPHGTQPSIIKHNKHHSIVFSTTLIETQPSWSDLGDTQPTLPVSHQTKISTTRTYRGKLTEKTFTETNNTSPTQNYVPATKGVLIYEKNNGTHHTEKNKVKHHTEKQTNYVSDRNVYPTFNSITTSSDWKMVTVFPTSGTSSSISHKTFSKKITKSQKINESSQLTASVKSTHRMTKAKANSKLSTAPTRRTPRLFERSSTETVTKTEEPIDSSTRRHLKSRVTAAPSLEDFFNTVTTERMPFSLIKRDNISKPPLTRYTDTLLSEFETLEHGLASSTSSPTKQQPSLYSHVTEHVATVMPSSSREMKNRSKRETDSTLVFTKPYVSPKSYNTTTKVLRRTVRPRNKYGGNQTKISRWHDLFDKTIYNFSNNTVPVRKRIVQILTDNNAQEKKKRVGAEVVEYLKELLDSIDSTHPSQPDEVNPTTASLYKLEWKCRPDVTPWSTAYIIGMSRFLQNHNIKCGNDEFLQNFHLKDNKDQYFPLFRYEYTCCQIMLRKPH